jgi:hypothetical protein
VLINLPRKAKSSLPSTIQTKRSTLTQEAVRILRNCSLSVPWSRRADLLSDLSLRLKLSGYTEHFRATVIRSALAAWDRLLELDRTGQQPLYRDRAWQRDRRNREKERNKKNWYRHLGGQDNDFPIFCPMSPGGKLAARWRKTLEQVRVSSGGRVRGYVAEQSGVPLSALLYSSQPGEQDSCGQADCNPCARGTTRRLSCRRVARGGMVYSCECITCKERGVAEGTRIQSWYHGETSRTLYTRQKEHYTGLQSRKQDNALFKHKELHHPETDPVFEFRPEKFFSDNISKQIFEGVSINNSPSSPGLLMNSKAEFRQGEVARVVLVRGLGE